MGQKYLQPWVQHQTSTQIACRIYGGKENLPSDRSITIFNKHRPTELQPKERQGTLQQALATAPRTQKETKLLSSEALLSDQKALRNSELSDPAASASLAIRSNGVINRSWATMSAAGWVGDSFGGHDKHGLKFG